MSAIIKFHTRKNKNSLLQQSSCSVQTQDYQISLKTRNIFCVAFRDCLTDIRAGGSSSSISWEGSDSCTHCSHLQPQSTTKSAQGLFRKWGCSSLDITEAAARAWPAEHGSLYWCYWEKQLQSVISAELMEMAILRFFSHKYFWQCSRSQIFSSLLMSRRYCTAAKHPRNQHWTSVRECINSGLLRALCLLQWEPSQGKD